VFIESPSYDRAITTLRRTGAEVVGIPLETDGVNLNVLEDELKKGTPTLMYVIADFQNPTGVTTSLGWLRWRKSMTFGLWKTHPIEDSDTGGRMFLPCAHWRRNGCCTCPRFPNCFHQVYAWAMQWVRPT
jgi:hypothetical protein